MGRSFKRDYVSRSNSDQGKDSGNPVFPAVNNLALPPASVSSERYRRQRLSYTRHNSAYASGLIRASKSDFRSANALGWTHLGIAWRVGSSSTKCSKKATAAAFCRSRDELGGDLRAALL